MVEQASFDLEKAIATWRHIHAQHRVFSEEDLDELERHLRDTVTGQMQAGATAAAAYEAAVQALGDVATGEEEYQKVRWAKLRKRRLVFHELHLRWAMLKNYIVIALRQVRRYPGFALINLTGLALGMACCLLILGYVYTEFSYDRFHDDADAIYRINWDFNHSGNEGIGSGTPPPLAARMLDNIPEVEAVTRLYPVSEQIVRYEDLFFNEARILGADTSFFAFFDFPLVQGNPATVLASPNSVVLTETAAHKYFGDEDPLGQTILIGETRQVFRGTYDNTFRVTGIVQDVPVTSHIQFDMLTSMASHPEVAFFDWSWIWMQVVTYAKLLDPATASIAEAKIVPLVEQYAPDAFDRVGFSYQDLIASGGRWDFVLQPMTDVYLDGATVGNRIGPVADQAYVIVFLMVGIFVLLIACINFMNLTTAQSVNRAREIGVRKVLGSKRSVLAGQFLAESLLFSFIALPLALGLLYAALGPFEQLAGKPLAFSDVVSPLFIGLLVVFVAGVGLLAGSYPGLYLSSFRPVDVLKGPFKATRGNQRLRQVLVVTQFVVTIGLIACTLLVQQQMSYLREADVGFDREHVVTVSNNQNRLGGNAEALRDRLAQHTAIQNASISTTVPPSPDIFQDYFKIEGRGDEQVEAMCYIADERFVGTLGIEIVEGRDFSEAFSTEARHVIVNEKAVQEFGWTHPIGKTITYPGVGTFTVIGVVQDFNAYAFRWPVQPFVLFHTSSEAFDIPESSLVIRFEEQALEAGLEALQAEWEAVVPDVPLEFTFIDDSFNAQYQAEERLGTLFAVFAALAIVIACMGLLGLVAFAAQQRAKELGVRKVLGASVPQLIGLFSASFLKLVLVAFLIAVPLAAVMMQAWLDGFARSTTVGWHVFAITGAIVLALVLLTVSYQAIKAALADPVKSLRYE